MRPEHRVEFEKIERVSSVLQVMFGLALMLCVAIPIIAISYIAITPTSDGVSHFVAEQPMQELTVSDDDLREGKLTAGDKLGLSLFLIVVMSCCGMFCWNVSNLMAQFKRHCVFSQTSVRFAKRAAYAFLTLFLIWFVGTWIAAFVIGDFRINGGITNAFMSLCFYWLFVWILQIGTALQTESEMTI